MKRKRVSITNVYEPPFICYFYLDIFPLLSLSLLEYIQGIMSMEERVQHTVMQLIQEVIL